MSNKQKMIIGFDRRIDIEWSNYTVELILQDLSDREISQRLETMLSAYGLGVSKGGALSKTITVLRRLWINVPDAVVPIRNEGIELFKNCTEDEKILLNMAMAILNYPFFLDVLTQIGRLQKLQDCFSSKQVTRRIIEKWGDTQRVARSVRHVLLTLKIWKVVRPLQQKSIYTGVCFDASEEIQLIIARSLANSISQIQSRQEIKRHPASFFCNISISLSKLKI